VLLIPVMSANLDALMRLNIPEGMQGRVYAVRNALQFFTIPVGIRWAGAGGCGVSADDANRCVLKCCSDG